MFCERDWNRETNFWFGSDNVGEVSADVPPCFNSYGLVREHTVVGVKPTAWEAHSESLKDVIAAHGYQLLAESSKALEAADCEALGLAADSDWTGAASQWLHLGRDGAVDGARSL